MSALGRSWTRVANTGSKSRSLLAFKIRSCSPSVCAASFTSFNIGLGIGVVRVHKHGEYGSGGHHLAQQLHALCYEHARNNAHARHVATGAVEAHDHATPDRVAAG